MSDPRRFPFDELPRVVVDILFNKMTVSELINFALVSSKMRLILENVRYCFGAVHIFTDKTTTLKIYSTSQTGEATTIFLTEWPEGVDRNNIRGSETSWGGIPIVVNTEKLVIDDNPEMPEMEINLNFKTDMERRAVAIYVLRLLARMMRATRLDFRGFGLFKHELECYSTIPYKYHTFVLGDLLLNQKPKDLQSVMLHLRAKYLELRPLGIPWKYNLPFTQHNIQVSYGHWVSIECIVHNPILKRMHLSSVRFETLEVSMLIKSWQYGLMGNLKYFKLILENPIDVSALISDLECFNWHPSLVAVYDFLDPTHAVGQINMILRKDGERAHYFVDDRGHSITFFTWTSKFLKRRAEEAMYPKTHRSH